LTKEKNKNNKRNFKEVRMEEITIRRPIPLQKFKIGERVIRRSDAIAGRRRGKIEIISEVLLDGLIRLEGKRGKFFPNHWERA